MLTFTWPISERPQLDPGWPKTMPRDSKAGVGFSGHLAFPASPSSFTSSGRAAVGQASAPCGSVA